MSANVPPSVIAAWRAIYSHSKSRHSSSFGMLSGALNVIIIVFRIANQSNNAQKE